MIDKENSNPVPRHRNSNPHTWQSPWLDDLPPSYFREFGEYLEDVYFPLSSFNMDYTKEWCRREFDIQLFVRMQQAKLILLPWIEEVINLKGMRVLEIGCGTGSSTIPLALQVDTVTALDISDISISANKKRAEILNIDNISYFLLNRDWLEKSNIDWPTNIDSYDIILCYAVLEHLTIAERLNFLTSLWNGIRKGASIIFFETPNRIFPTDWHSSGLPFAQILPDSLTAYYYSRSELPKEKLSVANSTYREISEDNRISLYRWGRGVSFHEFELSIGMDSFKVLNDGHSKKVSHHREKGYGNHRYFENALEEFFDKCSPRIPRGFTRASLDLIIQKL